MTTLAGLDHFHTGIWRQLDLATDGWTEKGGSYRSVRRRSAWGHERHFWGVWLSSTLPSIPDVMLTFRARSDIKSANLCPPSQAQLRQKKVCALHHRPCCDKSIDRA